MQWKRCCTSPALGCRASLTPVAAPLGHCSPPLWPYAEVMPSRQAARIRQVEQLASRTVWQRPAGLQVVKSGLPVQASFNPPGLTVSVKKDRAVESMLTPGRPFVVNILAQGKDKGVMKQLLKPFKPGEDRFQGLDTEVRVTFCIAWSVALP